MGCQSMAKSFCFTCLLICIFLSTKGAYYGANKISPSSFVFFIFPRLHSFAIGRNKEELKCKKIIF
jgi:hypothetical protein